LRVPAAVLGWRLGLGWLLGRNALLLTTQDRSGTVRRSLVKYRFYAGNLYVTDDGSSWAADLEHVPRATAQAHPGPLGVRRREPSPGERRVLGDGRWLVLEPTGEPVPPAIEPDLAWMWAPAAVLVAVAVLAARRRVTP